MYGRHIDKITLIWSIENSSYPEASLIFSFKYSSLRTLAILRAVLYDFINQLLAKDGRAIKEERKTALFIDQSDILFLASG